MEGSRECIESALVQEMCQERGEQLLTIQNTMLQNVTEVLGIGFDDHCL